VEAKPNDAGARGEASAAPGTDGGSAAPNPTNGGGFAVAAPRDAGGSAAALAVSYAPPVKRSVLIAGHSTSVSLEPLFWRALEEAAREIGCPLNALVARIDAARLEVAAPPNLTSALRQWLVARALSS
jgi:predicted DNA-binding ribbon-helix-helix protein